MTVLTTTNRVTYSGDSVSTAFAVPFKFAQNSDLVVLDVIAGVSTTKVLGTDYNVTGAGTPSGTVTFVSAPGLGHTVIIYRDPATTQVTDLVEGDPLPAESVETALDRIVMMVQRCKELVTRAFTLSDSVSGVSLTAPAPVANKYLRWNGTATGLENADVATAGLLGIPVALSDGGTAATTAAGARTNLGLAPAAAGDLLVGLGVNLTGVQSIGTDGYALTPVSGSSSKMAWVGPYPGLINGYIEATVAANALTFTLRTTSGGTPSTTSPVFVAHRSTTGGTPNIIIRKITTGTTFTIPAGEALGTSNGVPARLWFGLVDDAGTARIGVINCLKVVGGGATTVTPIRDDMLVATSTVAGSTSGFIYTGANLAGVSFRVAGYIEITEAAAGTWATAPSRIQHWAPGMKLPGDIAQVTSFTTGTVATGTTVIPGDNTIPQNTEGDQYMQLSITPTSAVNVLVVEADAQCAHSSAGTVMVLALFQDTTANALAAMSHTHGGAGQTVNLHLRTAPIIANTVSATTFKTRIGGAGAGTTTFNGSAGAQLYGGVMASGMRATEIVA